MEFPYEKKAALGGEGEKVRGHSDLDASVQIDDL